MTPEQDELFQKLTRLQRRTVTGVLSGMSQADAYAAAGGKARTRAGQLSGASELLANPKVRAFMQSMERSGVDAAAMTRQEAIQRLSVIARTPISDLLTFSTFDAMDKDGSAVQQSAWVLKDSKDMTPEQLSTIAELTAGATGLKIKQHSALQAIKQLSELLGWEEPKRQINENTNRTITVVNSPDFTPDDV